MDLDKELQQAIERGSRRNADRRKSDRAAQLSQEELRNRHTTFRLALSEHIEHALRKLQNHFPGFQYETIYGDKGWGGGLSRDDLALGPDGRGGEFFSRLEVTVRPQNEFNVVNISGKGTIKNKEMFNWNHFEDVEKAELGEFQDKIDHWILQYAEQFAGA